MFFGTFPLKLDEKGRFFLPKKFRERLATSLVITRQHDHCLAIWQTDEFITEMAQAAKGPSKNEKVREYQRMVASGASDEVADDQGRVTIPLPLRVYAGLKKEIVIIGALNRLEVWDAENWEKYLAPREDEFADINEETE